MNNRKELKSYKIKEAYLTIQGEGYHTGQTAVFVRFAGCNLWSGLEKDRVNAQCSFCDTDFIGLDGPNGGKYTANELTDVILNLWPDKSNPFVVMTGGEPMLQLDEALISALKAKQIYIALETNGTIEVIEGIDWICVSPKLKDKLEQDHGDELKLVYPQAELTPEKFQHLKFKHFFLQPMDGPMIAINTQEAIKYCTHQPKWRLSVQTHKFIGID